MIYLIIAVSITIAFRWGYTHGRRAFIDHHNDEAFLVYKRYLSQLPDSELLEILERTREKIEYLQKKRR